MLQPAESLLLFAIKHVDERLLPDVSQFEKDKYGEPGLNYLCQGYYQYYTHVAPYMDFMKRELPAQQAGKRS